MAAPNAPKLSDRLWEPAPAGIEKEQAGGVRGAAPAGAQAVAGGVTGAAPAAVEPPQTFTPGWEAVRCSALLGALITSSRIKTVGRMRDNKAVVRKDESRIVGTPLLGCQLKLVERAQHNVAATLKALLLREAG